MSAHEDEVVPDSENEGRMQNVAEPVPPVQPPVAGSSTTAASELSIVRRVTLKLPKAPVDAFNNGEIELGVSAAERAKMRSRGKAPVVQAEDVIEISSGAEEEPPKRKGKGKVSSFSIVPDSQAIPTPMSDDEDEDFQPTKGKTKTKPKPKKAKSIPKPRPIAKKVSAVPPLPLPSPPPMATVDSQISSGLPPSDFPPTSISNDSVPVLPVVPPSPPPTPKAKTKRKKAAVITGEDEEDIPKPPAKKPRRSAAERPAKKTREKKGAAAGSAFKSNVFTEDSEGDGGQPASHEHLSPAQPHELLLLEHMPLPAAPAASTSKPISAGSDLSSVPDSEQEFELEMPPVSISSKRKAGDASLSDAPKKKAPAKKGNKGKNVIFDSADEDGPLPSKPKKKAAAKGNKKKKGAVDEEKGPEDKAASPEPKPASRGRKSAVIVSEDEDEPVLPPSKGKRKARAPAILSDAEEDAEPVASAAPPKPAVKAKAAKSKAPAVVPHSSDEEDEQPPAPPPAPPRPSVRRKSIPQTGLAALINKVNSLPNTPGYGTPSRPSYGRSALSKIAPLHPNRKEPPKALPKPPAPKKSKKMLDLEEKWEDELKDEYEDSWLSMEPQERATLREGKRNKEMGYQSY